MLNEPASKKRQGTKSREVGRELGTEWLWGFEAGADIDDGRDAGRLRSPCLQAGAVESAQ
jgi:hypothetical protein